MPRFTDEEVKMLAEQARGMDAGKVFFVIYSGERLAVRDNVREDLGLTQGQTINGAVFRRILELHLAYTSAEVAVDKARKAAST